MSTTTTTQLTAEQFFALPDSLDGAKRELVRGEVVSMSSPGLRHGEVQANVVFAIKTFLKANPFGRVFVESGLVTDRKPDTVRGPDVSYYSKDRLPLDQLVIGYHDQPADLCVEVVSPSNTKKELRTKIREYFFAGVRMVWVVDPEDRSVVILGAPDEGRTVYDDAWIDGGDVLPGFSCQVSDLFT